MKNLIAKIISFISFGNKNILFLQFSRGLLPIIFKCLFNGKKIYFLEDRGIKFNWKNFTKEEYNRIKSTIDYLYREINIYFAHKGIDYLILDKLNRDNLWHHVVIMAARDNGIRIIYYEHGATGQNLPVVNYQKLLFADKYYAADWETQKFLHDEGKKWKIDHGIIFSNWNRPRSKRRNLFYSSKLVLIAPQFNLGEIFNELYPDTLKYKYNKVVFHKLEYLAKKYDLKVVWKMLPGSEEDEDPMFNYIVKHGDRVEVEIENNFNKLIKKAGMFITDCCSTTYYDAVGLGIPSFIYRYYKANPIRGEVKERLGGSLCVYSDIRRAVIAMECFIISNLNKEK